MRYIIIVICCLTLSSCFNQPKKESIKETSRYVADTTSIHNRTKPKQNIDTVIIEQDSLTDGNDLLQNNIESTLTIKNLEDLLLMKKEDFEKSVNDIGYFFDKIDSNRFFKVCVFYNSQKNQYLSYNVNTDTQKIYSVTLQTQKAKELQQIFSNLKNKNYTEKREEIVDNTAYEYYKFKDINEICFYKSGGIYSLSIENLRETKK